MPLTGRLALLCLLLLAAACSAALPAHLPAAVPTAEPALRNPPAAPQYDVAAEVQRLQAAMAREVPRAIRPEPAGDARWITMAKAMIASGPLTIDRPQLIVAVDRNPRVQEMRIIVAQPEDGPWAVIGGSKVSTGQADRKLYYITPTGVFLHTDAILDYRAEGTFNENHIRGLGRKGMRVWDFGWHTAAKGWRSDGETGDIRLLIHATDPDYLEQRLGRPASQGCIRVPAAMNKFMDRHGVLDVDIERTAIDDIRYAALLLPDRTPSPLAGNALVVVDSAVR